jgi:hypothetical protein
MDLRSFGAAVSEAAAVSDFSLTFSGVRKTRFGLAATPGSLAHASNLRVGISTIFHSSFERYQ